MTLLTRWLNRQSEMSFVICSKSIVCFHTRGTTQGKAIECYLGLIPHELWLFRAEATTDQHQSASVKAELREIVASFEPPPQ